jgi:hypothetical protein
MGFWAEGSTYRVGAGACVAGSHRDLLGGTGTFAVMVSAILYIATHPFVLLFVLFFFFRGHKMIHRTKPLFL